MKTNIPKTIAALALTALFALNAQLSTGFAQGTAFTYQGRLQDHGSPASGTYDLEFRLHDANTGGNQLGPALTQNAVGITAGLFTVTLDFGNQYPPRPCWLSIGVRTNGAASFITLNPRQELKPTPYAITAECVAVNGLAAGTYGNAVTFDNSANSFSGNGVGLTSLNADNLTSGTVPEAALGNAWKIGGNAGTSPTNGNFLGTTDFQPLDLKAGGMRVLRLEPDARTNVGGLSGNLIGGFINNAIEQPGSGGDFIGGGGYPAGPNVIHSNSAGVFIGAGSANQIGPNLNDAVIGGGYGNTSQGYDSVIGGGESNIILLNAAFAIIPGGYANAASGPYSFAAGRSEPCQYIQPSCGRWNVTRRRDNGSFHSVIISLPAGAGVLSHPRRLAITSTCSPVASNPMARDPWFASAICGTPLPPV